MSAQAAAAHDLSLIVAEVRELQALKTRTPPDGLAHILTAPQDGSEFKAVLLDGEAVTVIYDDEHHRRSGGISRWQDANGDDAPDGSCRTWHWPDFLGWCATPLSSETPNAG